MFCRCFVSLQLQLASVIYDLTSNKTIVYLLRPRKKTQNVLHLYRTTHQFHSIHISLHSLRKNDGYKRKEESRWRIPIPLNKVNSMYRSILAINIQKSSSEMEHIPTTHFITHLTSHSLFLCNNGKITKPYHQRI